VVSKEDLALADIDDVMMIMCKENKKKTFKKAYLKLRMQYNKKKLYGLNLKP